jgi:CheY-like chemotaxis protein
MESIAHLTAGIAHDFNNLLSVVLGNLELAQEFDIVDPNLRDMLARASEAADRGGVLTQRLLAFSRRQMLTPDEIVPRDLIEGMSGNLRRILGDAIQIHVELQDDIWPCRADPKQLAITLSSLAANSRDAMPDGGRLTIEGRNIDVGDDGHAIPGDVTPGEYVAFTVSDTGTGMPPDVVERAFEPFFTTKDIGADAGLGLGLSVVFGFITQSGGHATIRSGEGEGTSVRFILPRFIDSVAAEAPAAKVSPRLEAKTGNVVVVEDDTDVRELLVSQMNSLGYAVYGVATAAEAMDIIDARPEIDLLLSDVLLAGGTSGPRLAKEATNRRPDMAVLFMSGYVELKNVGLDAGDAVLHKPFSMAELAGKLRRALESRP